MDDAPREHGQDWAGQLAARLDRYVEVLRDYSVRPALGLGKAILIGVLAFIVGLAVLVLVLVGITKLFNTDVFGGRTWATDFLFGGMFIAAGALAIGLGARKRGSTNG